MSWTFNSCASDGSSGSRLRETIAELDATRNAAAAEGGNPGGHGRPCGDCAAAANPAPPRRTPDPGALLQGYSARFLEGFNSTGLRGMPLGLAEKAGTLAEGIKPRSPRRFPRTGSPGPTGLGDGVKLRIFGGLVLAGFREGKRSSIISFTRDL